MFKKAKTKEEQDFYISLSNILLQKQQSKVCQIGSITPAELKEIEELDRLEWQDDIIEKVQQEAQEKFQEKLKEQKINSARNLLDVLDDDTIADKTGLDINFIKSLRM